MFCYEANSADLRSAIDRAENATIAGMKRVEFTVALVQRDGTTLAQVAAGTRDADWIYLADKMQLLQPTGEILVRLGWEFNGDWYPWSARGKEADFVSAFRRVVDVFRSRGGRFVFDWSPNFSTVLTSNPLVYVNPEPAYPGDAYVDYVGISCYYTKAIDGSDPYGAFYYRKDAPYGLSWQTSFARQHQKKPCLSEWGIDQDGQQIYVSLMAQWMRMQSYTHHNYWDSTSNFNGQLSNNQYPTTGAAFRAAFGA